ncbi:MAG: ABC transporter permease [Thaumarchaeota archaeon]|nr:ABC transporter permease [Candidatus Calditenuaceae archaeon]MDW8186837.1 ABC transporter permease [Nitrososphaerota archaeon]
MVLISVSVYTIITIPYDEAVILWRAGEQHWLDVPRNAYPTWFSIVLQKRLPETIIADTSKPAVGSVKVIVPAGEQLRVLKSELSFRFEYDDFPSEINVFYRVHYSVSPPQITLTWVKPDGSQIELRKMAPSSDGSYYLMTDPRIVSEGLNRIQTATGERPDYELTAPVVLFGVEDASILKQETLQVMKGNYRLVIEGLLFDPHSDFDAKLVVYGKVYGWAGTDHLRRDIGIALLWGTPVALAFGVVAAISITLIQMTIGALSAWYSRVLDAAIQRINEVAIVLPLLPVLIMVQTLYKLNIWLILLIVIALFSLGPGVKFYRAQFLQLKELPYVEAAKAYGVGNFRIVFFHLMPRVLPSAIPPIVFAVPDFVFLEAVLAILGLGDPLTPTWGKVIEDAFYGGALFKGYYYWILEPSLLLVVTTMGFVSLGLALDKVFNPRLREV